MTKTKFSRIAVTAAAIAAAAAIPALADDLPNGNGKDTVQTICSGCHDLEPITSSGGFSKEDWTAVVQSMIAMGATIKPEEASAITAYLAQNFPPKKK